MRKYFCFGLFALSLTLGLSNNALAANEANRYIVRFENKGTRTGSRNDFISSLQKSNQKNIEKLSKVVKGSKAPNMKSLWIANSVAITANESSIKQIEKIPEVAEIVKCEYKIWLDKDLDKKRVKSNKNEIQWSVTKVRAPEVWEKLNIDGSGVVVGHLDSGVYAKHEALTGKVLKFKDFTPDASIEPFDGQGHGTHTAGTICGGMGVGVAPGARLIVGRIFDAKGGTTEEIILSAMQWVMDPDENPETNDGPALVSNSWGSNDSTDKTFVVAVQNWVNAGILPVYAAGNNGMWGGKVGTPAAFPQSWAVAATTNTDGLAYFSSQGPITWDDKPLMKPDISAPGQNIVSCADGDGLVSNSGTSMACPNVAGVAALMFQADPSLSIEQIRLIAEETAKDLGTPGKDGKFGSGLIDAYKIVEKVLQNSELADAYKAYESALNAEAALIGIKTKSPLAEPLAKSIIERTVSLDEGQFKALELKIAQSESEVLGKLFKEARSIRASQILQR
jgi:subtilisin family serine protease